MGMHSNDSNLHLDLDSWYQWHVTTQTQTAKGCTSYNNAMRYASSHLISHLISYHVTLYHITLYYITSHHITSHHITSHHITSHHHITLSLITSSLHITSYHIIPNHITSHHTIPYHIIPYHITSYHIIPYHIISHSITLCMLCRVYRVGRRAEHLPAVLSRIWEPCLPWQGRRGTGCDASSSSPQHSRWRHRSTAEGLREVEWSAGEKHR